MVKDLPKGLVQQEADILTNTNLLRKFKGCLLGLAIGDAVGTALEFKSRGSFEPIEDMIGGGPFNLQPGEWTDDTSMALCLATSLLDCEGFDAKDQMDKYCAWWQDGYLSSNGCCFDIGITVGDALMSYLDTGEPFSGSQDPYSAGNGSIMRLAPIPMYYYPDLEQAIHFSSESSRTTHGAQECLEATQLLTRCLFNSFNGVPKDRVLLPNAQTEYSSPKIAAIAQGGYRTKNSSEILGTGYVVESLEAAFWCFHTTDSFREAILKASNLGGDADTTAAICGQIAGAYYGIEGIPESWLELLVMKEEISVIAERLYETARRPAVYQVE